MRTITRHAGSAGDLTFTLGKEKYRSTPPPTNSHHNLCKFAIPFSLFHLSGFCCTGGFLWDVHKLQYTPRYVSALRHNEYTAGLFCTGSKYCASIQHCHFRWGWALVASASTHPNSEFFRQSRNRWLRSAASFRRFRFTINIAKIYQYSTSILGHVLNVSKALGW